MASTNTKLFFELPDEEKERRLKAVLDKEMKLVNEMNLPVIFRNELCTQPNFFIHKYPDGRVLLIEQDVYTSEEKVIKVLQ